MASCRGAGAVCSNGVERLLFTLTHDTAKVQFPTFGWCGSILSSPSSLSLLVLITSNRNATRKKPWKAMKQRKRDVKDMECLLLLLSFSLYLFLLLALVLTLALSCSLWLSLFLINQHFPIKCFIVWTDIPALWTDVNVLCLCCISTDGGLSTCSLFFTAGMTSFIYLMI